MKKLIYLIVLISVSVQAQSIDSLFVKANNLYKEAKYKKAIDLYQSIENKGFKSKELYYNLGNAHYKLKDVAATIYNYEKALQIDPNDKDVLFNLKLANKMTVDNIEVLPKTFIQKIDYAVIHKFNYNTWAWIAVIASILTCLLFLAYYFATNPNLKKVYFITSLASVLILIISIIIAFKESSFDKTHKEAIVFSVSVQVKNAPTLDSDVLFELHEGTKVTVLESVDNWEKIKIADGKTGWTITGDLKQL